MVKSLLHISSSICSHIHRQQLWDIGKKKLFQTSFCPIYLHKLINMKYMSLISDHKQIYLGTGLNLIVDCRFENAHKYNDLSFDPNMVS